MKQQKLIAFAVKRPYCAPGPFMVIAKDLETAKKMCEQSRWGPGGYEVTYAKWEQIIEWVDR